MRKIDDSLGTYRKLAVEGRQVGYFSLDALEAQGYGRISRFPVSIRVLLESVLRNSGNGSISEHHVVAAAGWTPEGGGVVEVPFMPSRVVLQDFTGVPAVVDLAAMRDACRERGGDPDLINPRVRCDLVVDHSLQVDEYGSPGALKRNLELEFRRNLERYGFLKWGQKNLENFHVVPPGTGIVHQVNLEHLSPVVHQEDSVAWPDSLVGTDSHTTMINALGVLGWGVGGIEAEAVMLGYPLFMPLPPVTGVRLTGVLGRQVTATDLVLTLTQLLRSQGVVGSFVEFFGPGLSSLSVPDRATIANMAPEYGATAGFFPIDDLTLEYLGMTGRGSRIPLVRAYAKAQQLWHEPFNEPDFSRVLEFDLGSVEPSLAGPKRPQDRRSLSSMSGHWTQALEEIYGRSDAGDGIEVSMKGERFRLTDGAVVIAAITSCTNTSNPPLLVAAGLLARNARRKGLMVPAWVKTSFAPGSRVVIDYLDEAGLLGDLEALGFANVGFGCTTCIGNSGPLPGPVASAVEKAGLVVAGVLSGNRNFEGRINPHVKANYLASPLLVVAYALAGNIGRNLDKEPLGLDREGREVYLHDIWPSDEEVRGVVDQVVRERYFTDRYADVFSGTPEWQAIEADNNPQYNWLPDSLYIRKPPFFDTSFSAFPASVSAARCLALLGDSVTTDHISPAGAIRPDQPAGRYLQDNGVDPSGFNSFGSRRGNHEVMVRGTFDNIRIRNLLVPGTEGGWTRFMLPGTADGPVMSIFDAAVRYRDEQVPLVVLAGKDYGMGSSRDWAAKGTRLLGVRAVIAESFERIHRSNLVGMGVLPLEFSAGDSVRSLGLTGSERFDIDLRKAFVPGGDVPVRTVHPETRKESTFSVISRIDTGAEVEYYRNGGILQTVLRSLLS
ncbi:aconitate hydratase AcnA [Prosthecochloris sp. HL-130-GSB]|jgi:aconitate hydratase|uniref:aconitate hydratase AcnA n=1 Tax=Prosthecochloris sp. HL-130-GSB TaxID=1974213 RepID=UPI000A1C1033|nr:aconitate hydratase AcnA [Prosthecochloris sp. HL-130-GSB]ARM31714.1 aconitate hydratase 1 [Prosthecochloris sp. HL-130-GSB]